MDIRALLERIEEGETSAYAAVVERFQRPLFGYLGRMGMTQGQAEDIAQETFLRAWTHLGRYDPGRSEFSTWLFTIARNLAIDEARREPPKRELTSHQQGEEVPGDTAPDPVQALIDAQRRVRLQAALRRLPVPDRSALALAYFSELDLASIARIEGCTTSAIKVRIHRAKQRLRELLENRDE